MSYSNYPPGVSDHTPGAPWNDNNPEPQEFDAQVSYTINCHAKVETEYYEGGYYDEDEEGSYYVKPEFNGTDENLQEAYEADHYTPLQLLKEYADYLRGQEPTKATLAKIKLIDSMEEEFYEAVTE